ncbi:hypothetical protein ARMGADRAFT_955558 [Armillaria gallica]|uniref:[histone H3]-trimethyl-L-lysine(4) demethylase n=1 Tax=Armillaria gallica TaxID=47427 RepID=A0A2H3E9T4_ARMGA|nr:hypothetical protein ARMGADRAFT_955558 [Armillaria gallica]
MHGSPSTSTPRGSPSKRNKSSRFTTPTPAQAVSNSASSSKLADQPASTFYSCISIPVEGAIPIEDEPTRDSRTPLPELSSEQKRAPRKSKTDALAAMKDREISYSVDRDDSEPPDLLEEMYRNAAPISVSPTLDLSTVKTTSPRGYKPPPNVSRPFEIQDCPEYFPTAEEFKDPMAYVNSIADEAKAFGICKIVPPEGWKMPFVTNTETFRFKTRLQRLNSIEAASRAKINFLEQLYRFHKQQGNARVVIPTINHKPLDLWLLKKEVNKLGGYEAVTRDKKWSELGRLLGYRGIQGLATQIKQSYLRVVLPYERFCDQPRNAPNTPSTSAQSGKPPSRSDTNGVDPAPAPAFSPLTPSSPLSEPPLDSDEEEDGPGTPTRPRRSRRVNSSDPTASNTKKSAVNAGPAVPVDIPAVLHSKIGAKEITEAHCEICLQDDNGTSMLLCDGCDCGFHTFCLTPRVKSIPKGQWYCHACLSGSGRDFGFDEGDEHTLSSFQARDAEFRSVWFKTHPPLKPENAMDVDDPTNTRIGNVTLSEYDMENEFWRLVQTPHETVEIEYGADVHSTTHGSAMPTMESHPLDPYAKDPWNLNNIPIVNDSLLRFIKSDISGMTVPWTYVGMTFSTFCWHNEDHYTYSINFMHWGETKTWYGIAGEDADLFEAAIRSEAPDLFEAQPDLLFQLVTLMNPHLVKEAGVRVYACNQRAGEFVITFPKSYHAGFNHGLNFNEAVNFALPDWLPHGRDCVQRYRDHRKLPVFSHDELVITITQQSQSITTAIWLIDSLREMTDREMRDRETARSMGMAQILDEQDRPEDQYQCAVCKAFCYLSQVTSSCTTQIVCVDHAHLLCDKADHQATYTLRKRFSDDELLEILAKVEERAAVPSTWQTKLSKLLSDSPKPPLRSLRALLAEGERINYHIPELAHLKKCVAKANEWVDEANAFIVRKQSRKRSRRSRGRHALNDVDDSDRPDRTLEDLYQVLKKVDMLGFDCPEIATLQNLAQRAEDMQKQADVLMGEDQDTEAEDYIERCRRLLLEGSSLNVLLDALVRMEQIVERVQLSKELKEKLDDGEITLTLEEVRQLLTRTRACNMPADDKYVLLLESRQRVGDTWEDRAKSVLSLPIKTIEELEAFANLDSNIPIDPTVLDRLMQARAKAKDFEKQALAWLHPEPDISKPRPQDVMRLVNRAEKDFKISAVRDLRVTAEIAVDLETRCEQVKNNKYRKSSNEDLFATLRQWRSYTRDHLKMFTLPFFDEVEKELGKHEQWLKELPWWCEEHEQPEGQDILDDVMACTRQEDDDPPTDEFFTCICNNPVRPPPAGIPSDAVQCDYCFARFHGECAKNGGSCPFCDHHHWNGEIRKERNWHFCYLPHILRNAPDITKNYSDDWRQLQIIIHRVDRLSAVIGQFLSYTSQPDHQRPDFIHQVRHYMRKLYKIQFAVSPNPDVSFGLDLAQLHRILAGRPPLVRPKKRKRPKFTFGQDIDRDWSDGTRCICRGRTPYLLNYATVQCESCEKHYHSGCVFFPQEPTAHARKHYICPLCCIRKGRPYPFAEVRVKPYAEGNIAPELYVNVEEMLDGCSKDIIYKKLPPPYMATLFVELVKFSPGQPETPNVEPHPLSSSSVPPPGSSRAPPPHNGVSHHTRHLPAAIPVASSSRPLSNSPSSGQHPPPPPWSRWNPPLPPPGSSPSLPRREIIPIEPQPLRKRKHYEDSPLEEFRPLRAPSPKRRSLEPPSLPSTSQTTTPVLPPLHTPRQTLSPSLAMIMSTPDPPYSGPTYDAHNARLLDVKTSPSLLPRNR